MSEKEHMLSRRTVLKTGTVAVAGGAAAGTGLWYSAQPALASHGEGWNADNPDDVTTTDGEIDDVVLTQDTQVYIEWSNLEEEDQDAKIEIRAKPDPDDLESGDSSSFDTITSGTVTLSGKEGENHYSMQDWGEYSEPSFIDEHFQIEEDHFEPESEGETDKTTIPLRLRVEIPEGNADAGLEAQPDDTEFTVTHTWKASSMTAGGDAVVAVSTNSSTV